MKKRLLYLLLHIITLFLEILPYGAVCNFGNPEGDPWRETFSYFDLTPFGYANFAPFITAVLTCGILLVLVIYCFTGKQKLAVLARNILFVTSLISLGPLLFGISFFSVIGALITIFLFANFVLLHLQIRKTQANS